MKHQEDNLRFFLSKKFACDFSEQGTGKTFTAIATALKSEGINRVLIVCPKHLIFNWDSELQVFGVPGEVITTFWFSNKKKREEAKKVVKDFDFIIVNYGHLKLESDFFTDLAKDESTFLIVDEAHEIGNIETKITQAVFQVAEHCKKALFLTGTPISNSPLRIYPLLELCNPGKYKDFDSFKYTYAEYALIDTGRMTRWGQPIRVEVVSNYKNLDLLYKELSQFSKRVTKEECLDLPERVFVDRYIEMEPKQAKMYKQALEELIIELSNSEMIDVSLPITKVTRLRQLCSNPLIFDENYIDPNKELVSEKVLLEDLKNYPGKVVVVVSYKHTFHRLEQVFKRNKIKFVSVRGGEKNVGKKVKEFNENESCKVFLGVVDSIYTGLNLQTASTLIMYENTYNLLHYSQVIDRVHRKGQKNKVVVLRYIRRHPSIPEKTADEIILESLNKKIGTEGAVLRFFAKKLINPLDKVI
jgi:SNF2 family DNA or RNA helicase